MTDRQPNVVWVTLDSVRYDATSMAGAARDTTPRMADLASGEGGVSLTNCFAHGNWTLASSGALLTGTPASRNTLGVDGEYLPETVPTVAERFRDAGFRTACLSRNTHVSAGTGLDRGFDRFEWVAADTILDAAGPVTLLKYLLNIRRHSAGVDTDTARHATPYLLNEIAGNWLGDLAADQPFFFYLHYNEPHRPYYPPLSWMDTYSDALAEYDLTPEAAARIAMDIHYDYSEIIADSTPEELPLSERELAALRIMYDTEVAYTDEMVGRLIEHIRASAPNTVVVVTADHGELFGENGLLAHRYLLHDALLHVPCVIAGPRGGATGAVQSALAALREGRTELVQHNDLIHTLLAAVGADTAGLGGIDLCTGERDAVFASHESTESEFDDLLSVDPSFDTSRFHTGTFHMVRTQDWKYQRGADRSELFALPDETTDVAAAHPEVVDRLAARLDDYLADEGAPADEARSGQFTDAQREQLRDLGYVQ